MSHSDTNPGPRLPSLFGKGPDLSSLTLESGVGPGPDPERESAVLLRD